MERARHQLLAALGHDLREPLHSISLAAQVLKARGEQEISTRIAKTSGRMSRLVVQILDRFAEARVKRTLREENNVIVRSEQKPPV